MKISPFFYVLPVAAVCIVANEPVMATPEDIVLDSADTIVSFVESRTERIPRYLIRQAQAIAIVPKVISAGFIFGGTRGDGVLLLRDERGQWGNPAIVSISAGSVGLQIGAKSTDVVLLFMNKRSARSALRESFTLGGNVSVAAGPLSKDPVNPSDAPGRTDVFSYSRSEGLFAGVALEGAKLGFERDLTQDLYQRRSLSIRQVFDDRTLRAPSVIRELHQALYNAQR